MFARTDPKLADLATIEALEGASASELALAARLTTGVSFASGEVLCREGGRGLEAFLVVSGEVVVTRGGAELTHLRAGAIVGELAVLGHARRTATVTALTPVEAFVMSRLELERLLELLPEASRRIHEDAQARLRDLAA